MVKGKKESLSEEIKEISSADFDPFIKENKVAFVDFFAEWCMPCVMMVPVVEELARSFSGKVAFAKMNIDENHDTASGLKVMSIPTFMIFKKGEPVQRFTGAMSVDMLKEKIESCLK
ncbi:MAG: thioredoxin [archaeon]